MAKREYQTYKIIKIRLKVLLKFAPLKLALRKRGFSPIKIDFSSYKAKKKKSILPNIKIRRNKKRYPSFY